jgi:hypothetical protein
VLSEGSWVDPVTNLAVLTAVDLRDHMGLVMSRQLPGHCFAPFVHELTHHWCFHSSVGNTLASLALRARRNALHIANADDEFAVIDDVVRFETAVAMLRPFAEGLAVFAELDLRPGRSQVRSTPMLWTWLMFAGEDGHDEEEESAPSSGIPEADLQTFGVVYNVRLGDELRERKENVLVQPLTCAGGGYLPGYLGIKGLWWYAASKDALFEDADFFFTFLRNYFYEDLGLVSVLLKPRTANISAGDAIIEHIAARFNQLLSADLSKAAHALETFIARIKPGDGTLTEIESPPPMLTSQEQAATGRQRYDEMYHSIRAEGDAHTTSGEVARVHAWTLAQRECMCLASAAVELRISEDRWVGIFFDGLPVQGGPGIDSAEPGRMGGKLQLFFSPAYGYVVFVASVDGRAVFVNFLGAVDDKIREQFLGYMVERDLAIDYYEESRNTLERILASGEHIGLVNSWRGTVDTAVERMYGQVAMVLADRTRADGIRAMMARDGFWSVLERDGAAIRGLAYLGLIQSVGVAKHARELFEANGLSYDDTLQRLEAAEARTGFPLVRRDDGQAYVLV